MSLNVCVERVRFRGNGAIFIGRVVTDSGIQTGEEIVVRCPGNILYPRKEVFKGELWGISGFKESYKGNQQLGAVKAFLMRPAGNNIIAALAFNPKFEGIGEKKARELWATFGQELYDILDADEPDITTLQQVLTPEAAKSLCHTWKAQYSSDLYRWMDEHQLPVALGRKLQEHYGSEARSVIEKDPYRVLAFGLPWPQVDRFARRLGIVENDPRRQHAAVAEILYRHFGKGHTAIPTVSLTVHVERLIGSQNNEVERQDNTRAALKHTYTDGVFVRTGDLWQATGVFLMEAFVAARICKMTVSGNVERGHLLDSIIQRAISHYEETEHVLSDEQKSAVLLALKSRCCVITGAAGVGKTSVLRCLYNIIEITNGHILQMALSGRAARRMEEASGRPARTIAGFLTQIKQEELESVTHAVIDEASMLDVVSAFQILEKLPERISLILVGDPYQLPPIGAGLTFHVLADCKIVPAAHLTRIYRQSSESGIPTISGSIRKGVWPFIPMYCGKETGVFSLQVASSEITARLMETYEELGGTDNPEDVQILSAIKANTPYGVIGVNKTFHARYTEGEHIVLFQSPTGNLIDSGFRQGDKILVTKNQWKQGLFNGSLGYITEAFRTPAIVDEGRSAVAKAIIDGREIHLTQNDFEWIIHGYSISIHKAQGSQFKRVVVPISKSKLLDRTLIYTAITRGVNQVVLLGDMVAAQSAVEAVPHAWRRQIGFDILIRNSVRLEQQHDQ